MVLKHVSAPVKNHNTSFTGIISKFKWSRIFKVFNFKAIKEVSYRATTAEQLFNQSCIA